MGFLVSSQKQLMGAGGELQYGRWGFDLSGRDTAVRPGDNFVRYANGGYLDHLTIPPDRPVYSTGSTLTDSAQQRVRLLLEDAARPARAGSLEQLAGDYYASFMDEVRIERLGLSPLAAALQSIRRADSREKLASLMGRENASFLGSIFHLAISPDVMDPSSYTVQISQPQLGLPDRGYYLRSDLSEQRRDYKTYIARLLALAHWPQPDDIAAQILDFETSIAEVSWDREQERDSSKTYNPLTVQQLEISAPGFPWDVFLNVEGVTHEKRVIVVEKSAIPQIAALYQRAPLDLLQAWITFALLDHAAPYLSKGFSDAAFDLHGRSLGGSRQPSERWKRALRLVGSANEMTHIESIANTGDAVGQLYVRRYFKPEAREDVEQLVGNLVAALRARINALNWMSPATKAEALRKLDSYTIQVGYPDHWRDYEGLHIVRDDLVGNIERVAAFNWRFRVNQLGESVDQRAWLMEPQTVNAYHEGALRQIVFSAALLQPPVFDPQADLAVNYGGIGAIIGHELTHGFDDQGRRFDSNGRMRDWWTADDTRNFLAKAANLGAQFDACEPLPGLHVNGRLTMGENIADLGGLALALDAYHASLKGRSAPVFDGLSGDQRFFLSFAQVRRSKQTEQSLRAQILTDPHTPDECRVNITVRNIDAWYAAFDVTMSDQLYLSPQNRIALW
jgi:putative endopeptidase